ncbi:MAG: Uma2 family endonuclease, partial [Spirulina sp.]
MDNGAILGWLIDPKNRKVEVYRLRSEVEVLSNPVELSGEEVLLGFRLNMRRVWG